MKVLGKKGTDCKLGQDNTYLQHDHNIVQRKIKKKGQDIQPVHDKNLQKAGFSLRFGSED